MRRHVTIERQFGRHTGNWLALVIIIASGFPAISAAGARPCKRGAPECPIFLNLQPNQKLYVVTGRLSPKRSNFSYAFSGQEGQAFSWKYNGPVVRMILKYPDDNIDGPGLDTDIKLTKPGTYIFGISSNTMADKIYGYFRLQFKLKSNL